ncbi:MAG: MFS transporter [Hyphomicrobiales bacterium]
MATHAGQRIPTPALILLALGPFALGYFFAYLYRAVNAVVAPDLVKDLALSAKGLGFLTATYLIAYSAAQLPIGVAFDRFGPRRVQATMLSVAASGALLFSVARNFETLAVARALVGAGCAGSLMAGFKAVAMWLPEPRRPLGNACIMAIGGLGVLTATVPSEAVAAQFGWRGLFLILAAATIVVAGLIYLLVPEKPQAAARPVTFGELAKSLGTIYSDPVFWRVAPMVASTCGGQIAIQTLWAGPWLRDVAGMARADVASILAWMAIGFMVGALLTGFAADRLVRRGFSLLALAPGFAVIFLAAELLVTLNWTGAPGPVWFVFGMFGQATILLFPWLATYFGGAAAAGRSNAALNVFVFGTAFAAQYAIGAVLDLWPKTDAGGYDPQGYQVAIGLCLAVQVLTLLWYFLSMPRETARAATAIA